MGEPTPAEELTLRQQWTAERDSFLQELLKANASGMSDRIRAAGVTAEYDRQEDILYVYIGDTVLPGGMHRLSQSVYVRFSSDTYAILGFEVHGFLRNRTKVEVSEAFGILGDAAVKLGRVMIPPGHDAQAAAEKFDAALAAA